MTGLPAILLFSRSAAVESKHKRLVKGQLRNQQVLRAMIARTKRLVSATNLPVYTYTESEQKGQDFGGRLSQAIAEVMDKGHEQVIVLGNDSPQLRGRDLLNAADLLSAGDQLVGRDSHGGAYLIGLQKKHFNAQRFAALPWQTNQLFNALAALIDEATAARLDACCPCKSEDEKQNGRLVFLRSLQDINALNDLRRISDFIQHQAWLWRVVASFLARPTAAFFTPPAVRNTLFTKTAISRRGPPALL